MTGERGSWGGEQQGPKGCAGRETRRGRAEGDTRRRPSGGPEGKSGSGTARRGAARRSRSGPAAVREREGGGRERGKEGRGGGGHGGEGAGGGEIHGCEQARFPGRPLVAAVDDVGRPSAEGPLTGCTWRRVQALRLQGLIAEAPPRAQPRRGTSGPCTAAAQPRDRDDTARRSRGKGGRGGGGAPAPADTVREGARGGEERRPSLNAPEFLNAPGDLLGLGGEETRQFARGGLSISHAWHPPSPPLPGPGQE